MPWLWTDTPFVLFGPAHLFALGLTAALAVALAWIGRTLRRRAAIARGNGARAAPASEVCQCPALRQLSRGLALTILICLGTMQVVMLLPQHFVIGRSLPLQICDVAWIIAIHALWTNRRWAFALVYYWGLTATVLAMATPDLKHGFPHFYFWMFYVGHGAVVVAAVYLCWGVGLRPDWRLFRLTALVTIGYAMCIYLVNVVLGTNFFCVNDKPAPGTMLDYFGPYPMHILVGAAIALSAWTALTWPWQWLAARNNQEIDHEHGQRFSGGVHDSRRA